MPSKPISSGLPLALRITVLCSASVPGNPALAFSRKGPHRKAPSAPSCRCSRGQAPRAPCWNFTKTMTSAEINPAPPWNIMLPGLVVSRTVKSSFGVGEVAGSRWALGTTSTRVSLFQADRVRRSSPRKIRYLLCQRHAPAKLTKHPVGPSFSGTWRDADAGPRPDTGFTRLSVVPKRVVARGSRPGGPLTDRFGPGGNPCHEMRRACAFAVPRPKGCSPSFRH